MEPGYLWREKERQKIGVETRGVQTAHEAELFHQYSQRLDKNA